jgi:hypothetical protein
MMRTSSMPEIDKCRPDRTSSVITRKDREIPLLRTTQWEALEERECPLDEISGTCHLEIVNAVPAVAHRSHAEGRAKELRELITDLRHI